MRSLQNKIWSIHHLLQLYLVKLSVTFQMSDSTTNLQNIVDHIDSGHYNRFAQELGVTENRMWFTGYASNLLVVNLKSSFR
jgi:hypothetical protein